MGPNALPLGCDGGEVDGDAERNADMNDTILLLGSVVGTGLTMALVLWRVIHAVRTDMVAAVAGLRADTKADIAACYEAIAGVRTEMKEGIAGVRTEMKEGIAGVRTDMQEGIAGVRTDLREAIKELRDNDLKHMEARVDRFDHRLTTGLGEVREEMRGFRSEVKAEVSDLRAEMGGLRSEMGVLRSEVKADIGDLRSEMGGLRAEMNTAIHDIRADMRENHRQLLNAVQALPIAS